MGLQQQCIPQNTRSPKISGIMKIVLIFLKTRKLKTVRFRFMLALEIILLNRNNMIVPKNSGWPILFLWVLLGKISWMAAQAVSFSRERCHQ